MIKYFFGKNYKKWDKFIGVMISNLQNNLKIFSVSEIASFLLYLKKKPIGVTLGLLDASQMIILS